MNYNRIDKASVKRIEGLVTRKSLNEFKSAIEEIAEKMVEDGWDVKDVYDYLAQVIENDLEKRF